MSSVTKSLVLIAVLAGQLAQAGEKQLFATTTAAEMRQEVPTARAEPTTTGDINSRIALETLIGGAGAIGGGLLGFSMGYQSGDLANAGFGLLGGVALGSWLGTSLGGGLVGGTGNMAFTLLGTAAGSLLSMLLVPALAQTGSEVLVLGAVVALPLTGAIIGYESSQDPNRRAAFNFMPTIALTRDGKGATTGIAGTF